MLAGLQPYPQVQVGQPIKVQLPHGLPIKVLILAGLQPYPQVLAGTPIEVQPQPGQPAGIHR